VTLEMACRSPVMGGFSSAGVRSGDAEDLACITGMSELARLSWRLDKTFDLGGWPLVAPGVVGVAFSFATRPLSCTS
jgi:hypothetical protein